MLNLVKGALAALLATPVGSNVVAPLATRLGTLATGGLIGLGANSTHADWVGTGIAGGFFIVTDLGLAWLRKRSIQNKAMAEGADVAFAAMPVSELEHFAGWLTTRPDSIVVGAQEEVYPLFDAVEEYRGKRK